MAAGNSGSGIEAFPDLAINQSSQKKFYQVKVKWLSRDSGADALRKH